MRSHPWLKRLYREYNKKYFDNKLPNDIWVIFGGARDWRTAKLSKNTCAATFFEDHKPIGIAIRYYRFKTGPYVKSDLLHEMIHVARPRVGHGRTFKQEVRRLAALGALDNIL